MKRILFPSMVLGICFWNACTETPKSETNPTEEQIENLEEEETSKEGLSIDLGVGIADIKIGMTYAEIKEIYGDIGNISVWNRMGSGQYSDIGVEVVFASSDDANLQDDAVVLGVAALLTGDFTGELTPLMYQEDIEAIYGPPEITVENRIYYAQGFAAELAPDGKILKLAILPAYETLPEPPEMEFSASEPIADYPLPTPLPVDPENPEIIDIHLHTGKVGNQNIAGRSFIISMLPNSSKLYYPGSNPATSKPYSPNTGIASQLKMAGIHKGVLLATYAQHTVSYTTNQYLESLLTDPRNTTEDGTPRFWGMVSINLDHLDEPGLYDQRLAAMSSYLENRPDLFIGIKLAHAHQQVAFDDERHHALFDVAGEYGVPVLLHTGFSPFPGTSDDPEFYDPISLEMSIQKYEGTLGHPRVDFVLAHVGQGDQRAIDNALHLASNYDNVWLEISALGGGVLLNSHGDPIDSQEAQYVELLHQIKALGLEDRTIFASDGPQYSGKIRSYLNEIVDEMHAQEYSDDAIQKILGGNFYSCFFGIE